MAVMWWCPGLKAETEDCGYGCIGCECRRCSGESPRVVSNPGSGGKMGSLNKDAYQKLLNLVSEAYEVGFDEGLGVYELIEMNGREFDICAIGKRITQILLQHEGEVKNAIHGHY